jgi:hypothetical protein
MLRSPRSLLRVPQKEEKKNRLKKFIKKITEQKLQQNKSINNILRKDTYLTFHFTLNIITMECTIKVRPSKFLTLEMATYNCP